MTKTPGQIAYEADVAAKPNYPSGRPRARWDQLSLLVQSSWEKQPTPRWRKPKPAPCDCAPDLPSQRCKRYCAGECNGYPD